MASTELEAPRPGLERPRSEIAGARIGGVPGLRSLHVGPGARARVLVTTVWPDLAGIAFLLGIVTLVHWRTFTGAGLYARSDTFTYFYPVFAALRQSLRAGELPLWSPDIFGGFPLFAEGQIGALYPPAWLAVRLASPVDGFLALRAFHVTLAVLGPYLLARTLEITPVGACIAGLVFGLGSFVVGQQHHANLLAAAVWMPVLLAIVQAALLRRGWLGLGLLGLAGLVLGVQALATHVQPLMLAAALLVTFVLWRQLVHAVAAVRTLTSGLGGRRVMVRELGWGILALTIVPVVGALVGSAQLLPLLELSQESWRAHGFSYQDATEYSLPPLNLLTLIFPFFFRVGDAGQWSLWQAWEVVLYVGIVPLFLAGAAIVSVRRWTVAYFAVVALTTTLVSLGGYAPYGLYGVLLQIPGMSVQRAPARFSMLSTLAFGILAAHGSDWLVRRTRGRTGGDRALVALQLAALAALGALVVHLVAWRAWLSADRSWALELVGSTYLRLPRDPLQALSPLDVVLGLDASLDLANPKTAVPLGLLAALALLLLAWREVPRLSRLWTAALVLLVAGDLVLFALDFHPMIQADDLASVGPAAQFLAARAGQGRVLTSPDVESTQPNRLLPLGVEEASGYSPLQLDRQRWYASAVDSVDNSLLDLWGVRWVVEPRTSPSLPSYEQVAYHPRRPLMVGGAGTPNGQLALQVPAVPATEIRMVVAIRDGAEIAAGELVGEWRLTDDRGVRTIVPVRAGREVADDRHGQPGVRTAHGPATVAGRLPAEAGQPARVLSYAAATLPGRMTIVRADYRHIHPLGQSAVYGLTLYDATADRFEQVARQAKYEPVFRDEALTIFENRAAFDRAFVVADAIWVQDADEAQDRLQQGPFDPRRQAILEGTPPFPTAGQPGTSGGATAVGGATTLGDATAAVTDETWRSSTLRVSSSVEGHLIVTDPWYPGWRAFVDGEETTILRADYLFRAVALPAGEHVVWFVLDPPSLRLGAVLARVGLALGLAVMAVALIGRGLRYRVRWRWTS